MIIEDFNLLSEEELSEFAANIVAKVNEAQPFTKEDSDAIQFEIDNVETNELDGSLLIYIVSSEDLSVARAASWTADDPDSLNSYSDLTFDDTDLTAAKENLKVLVAEVDGYNVELTDIEFENNGVDEVEYADYSEEEGGIGDYEYWGHRGHNSYTYCTVYGTAFCNQTLLGTLVVTAK